MEDQPASTNSFSEFYQNALEEFDKQDPLPIFKGAILASGNKLTTSKNRFFDLFTAMQNGKFDYPEVDEAKG